MEAVKRVTLRGRIDSRTHRRHLKLVGERLSEAWRGRGVGEWIVVAVTGGAEYESVLMESCEYDGVERTGFAMSEMFFGEEL